MINSANMKNFQPKYTAGERMTLPAGVYEGHIINSRIDVTETGETLLVQVDIDKGEFTGFYRKLFEQQHKQGSQFNIRYRGVYRVQLPDGKNPEHDNWRQHQLEGLAFALEDGNPGYKWDWDENKLKGLKCGLNVREREYYVNGKHGTATEIGRIESIKAMNDPDESKRPKPMKKRELNAKDKQRMAEDQANKNGFVEVTDEQLPF